MRAMKDLQPPEPYNSWALKFYGLLTETLEHLISFCGSVRLQWWVFFRCSIIAVYIPFPRNCALLTPQKGNSMQTPISSRNQNLHHNSQRRGIIIPAYLYAWTPLCTPNRHRGQSSVRSEEDYCHDVKEWQVIMMNSVSH